jgi:hypothetical protein
MKLFLPADIPRTYGKKGKNKMHTCIQQLKNLANVYSCKTDEVWVITTEGSIHDNYHSLQYLLSMPLT